MQFETKKEIREALIGRTIKRIEFGPPRYELKHGSDPEIRSMMLVLDNDDAVAVAATTYQALAIGSD